MNKNIASLFTGIGCVEAGAVDAGYTPIWGIDHNNEAATIYKANFPNSRVYDWDIAQIDRQHWVTLQQPYLLHVSQPCQSFSIANKYVHENVKDTKLAVSICLAIDVLNPKVITFENVPAYIRSTSWALILEALYAQGYYVTSGVYLMSEWGVPQDRSRFFAVAQKDRANINIIPSYKNKTIKQSLDDIVFSFKESELTNGQKYNFNDNDYRVLNNILNKKSDEMMLIQRIGIRDNTRCRVDKAFTILSKIATDGKGSSRKVFLNLAYRGKIYSVSSRGVARLMGVPDWYKVEGFKNKDIIGGLGNGVCSEFYRQLLGFLL